MKKRKKSLKNYFTDKRGNMSYNVDFHIHTYYSDGVMKPTDVVRMYKDKEYDIISITDHDGVDGVNEAKIAGEALKIQVVPGIELSTEYDFKNKKIEFHLLGYYIDIDNPELNEKLKEIRRDRKDRNERLLALLNEKGYELSREDLIEREGQTYIGKPNFERAMKRKGYNPENMWDLFNSVEKKKISIEEGIRLIKGAGGIPVLAHPLKTRNLGEKDSREFWDNLKEIILDLKKKGLKGIECYHPSANQTQANNLAVLAGKYHLHMTEGSDFHEPAYHETVL